MDYISDLHEPRTNAEQSETAGDLRVSNESQNWERFYADFELDPVVYFIGAPNGLVKIGFARDLDARFSQILASSPVPLRILAWKVGGRKEEGEYHARFKVYRRHYEWFELSAEIQAEIARLSGTSANA